MSLGSRPAMCAARRSNRCARWLSAQRLDCAPTAGPGMGSDPQAEPDAVIDGGVDVARGDGIADAQQHEAALRVALRKNVAAADEPLVVDRATVFRQR